MRVGIVSLVAAAAVLTGCGGKTSSLLLERRAIGPLAESPRHAQPLEWQLEPQTQTQTQGQIEATVTFASQSFLQTFFSDKEIFENFAGMNPYFPENIVFYVRIANRSSKRIRINPAEFVLLDDRNNEFALLNVDYVTAFEEYRQPVSTATRSLLEGASPGYFGISIPVGKIFAAKPQHRFALIKKSSLQTTYLHPGVAHDGLVAFWNPGKQSATLRLLVTNVKADFDANDFPQTSLEFPFTFRVAKVAIALTPAELKKAQAAARKAQQAEQKAKKQAQPKPAKPQTQTQTR
jgi:hypothetical protein